MQDDKITMASGSIEAAGHSGVPITVIIPTKNRPADLRLAVDTVLKQSDPPEELLIVDQSSSSEGFDAVTRLYEDAPERVRGRVALKYLRDPAIPGLTAARNLATAISSCGIWLFLDDDVALEPDFLHEIRQVYRKQPDVAGVAGVITNYRRPTAAFHLWSSIFIRGPFHDPRQYLYWNADRLRNHEPVAVDRFGGGLMSFRADVAGKVRFDENVVGCSAGEDVDFCLRLPPGARLVITPRARLAHYHSPSGRETSHWLRRSVRSQVYIYRKNQRRGLFNRACYVWLMTGYGAAALASSLRSLSLRSWRALQAGYREGKAIADRSS